MADAMIAALDDAARFDPDQISASAASVWPRAVYTPYRDQLAQAAKGELELGSADGQVVFVAFLVGDNGLGVEGDDVLAAEFIEWLAAEYRFPDDGRVLMTDWAIDLLPVAAGITAAELLEQRAS